MISFHISFNFRIPSLGARWQAADGETRWRTTASWPTNIYNVGIFIYILIHP